MGRVSDTGYIHRGRTSVTSGGKGMRVLNNTKARQIRIDQRRMRADVHRKKSNRFITSKEEKNEEDRRTVAIVLLLEWTGVETVSLSLSVSWCIS